MRAKLRSGRGVASLAALAALAITAACSTAATSDGGKPSRGGSLVIARAEEGRTLDPAAAGSPADIAVTNPIYDRLFETSGDGKSIEPSLAQSVPTSTDGKSWTIKLRQGVVFSDGTPVTAKDVKFSLDRSRTSDGAFSFLLGSITSVKVVNERTVQITTSQPSATLLPSLSSWVASILPAGLDGKSAKDFFKAPIGSGPFTLDVWKRGRYVKLDRNTRYWRSEKPLVDSVRWNLVPDANTRVSQVRGGQADIAGDIPFSQVTGLKDAAGVTAGSFPQNYTSVLVFNQKYKPFADVHVRRAIAHAIDRKTITKSALFGSGTAACSLVPPTMPYSANKNCLPFDVTAAKAELSKSEYPKGFSADLTIDNLPVSSTVAQLAQAELADIGIKIKIKVIDSGQLYTTLGNRAYQMGLAAWASDIADPDEQLTFMLDPSAGGDSYYTGYDNAKVTDLVNRARVTVNPGKRQNLYAQVQQIVAQDVPQLPISNQAGVYAWSRTVKQFRVSPMGTMDLLDVGIGR